GFFVPNPPTELFYTLTVAVSRGCRRLVVAPLRKSKPLRSGVSSFNRDIDTPRSSSTSPIRLLSTRRKSLPSHSRSSQTYTVPAHPLILKSSTSVDTTGRHERNMAIEAAN